MCRYGGWFARSRVYFLRLIRGDLSSVFDAQRSRDDW